MTLRTVELWACAQLSYDLVHSWVTTLCTVGLWPCALLRYDLVHSWVAYLCTVQLWPCTHSWVTTFCTVELWPSWSCVMTWYHVFSYLFQSVILSKFIGFLTLIIIFLITKVAEYTWCEQIDTFVSTVKVTRNSSQTYHQAVKLYDMTNPIIYFHFKRSIDP